MNVLITNDDGIHAKGLWALHKAFSTRHAVTVIAPDRERSAVGHGITLMDPIRAEKKTLSKNQWGYAVTGTPADCIKLGILELLDKKPDMVISGINPGANTGVNINYSGTVAAAKEATIYGIPSIAASIQGFRPDYYDEAAEFILKLAETTYENTLPFGTLLNVNLPDIPISRIKGIKISRQGITLFKEYIEKKSDPRKKSYYWHGAETRITYDDALIDGSVVENNCISITPLKCDMTDYNMMDELKTWDITKCL